MTAHSLKKIALYIFEYVSIFLPYSTMREWN